MSVMKVVDIIAKTQRRAKKIPPERAIYFLNHLIKNDILTAVYSTYPEYFRKEETIQTTTGTTEYPLSEPGIGWAIYQNGDERLYRDSGVYVMNDKLIVPADFPNKKLKVVYNKKFPVIAQNDGIDLPADILESLIPIFVAGIEYYYFSDNKKTQETAVSFNRYLDARKNILTYQVSSII